MKSKFKTVPATAFAALLGISALIVSACSTPLPKGQAGPAAEKLTARVLQGMNHEAWTKGTAAVQWVFGGSNRHFWDKARGLIEVRHGDVVVQFKSDFTKTVVFEDGKRVTGEKAVEMTKEAYGYFINDGFWLNPAAHILSPGTTRKITQDGKLIVTFASGGVTPGDSYLFTLDKENRIKEMRLWTSVLPVKGARAEFSDYFKSATGVVVAMKHAIFGFIPVNTTDIKMFAQYPPADGKDRFAELLK